jgi:hypothetical protein
VKDRLIDLEAVYDVLESEIEETALDCRHDAPQLPHAGLLVPLGAPPARRG